MEIFSNAFRHNLSLFPPKSSFRRPIASNTWLQVSGAQNSNDRRNEHDLCDISLPKATAAGPRQRDGVRGGRGGRLYRAAARQSHLVVSLAQRVTALAATRPLHRSRPDRHGRLREAARQWPWLVSLRRTPPLPRRLARGSGRTRARHVRHPRLGLGPRLRLGQPPPRGREGHRVHGGDRAATGLGPLGQDKYASSLAGTAFRGW